MMIIEVMGLDGRAHMIDVTNCDIYRIKDTSNNEIHTMIETQVSCFVTSLPYSEVRKLVQELSYLGGTSGFVSQFDVDKKIKN